MLSRTNVTTPRTLRSRSAAVLAALMLLGGFFVPLAPAQAVIAGITVGSPAGGEIWSGTHNITWTTLPLADPETVDIFLRDSLNNETTIALSETNDGVYSWNTATTLAGPTTDDTGYSIIMRRAGQAAPIGFSGAFEIDNTAPVLNTITSSVTDGAPAGVLQIGDSITFTASATTTEPAALVTGSYNGTALTPWVTLDSGVTYTATYTVASGSADQSSALQISGVTMGDHADARNVSAAQSGSDVTVTIDGTRPTLTSVSIASNHVNTAFAQTGSVATLTFTSSESIGAPTVTIAGNPALVAGGPTNWTATYTFAGTEAEGVVPFSVTFSDVNGNAAAAAVTATTNSSSVTYDETIPTISSITTKDANGNGSVDTATIVFDAAVDGSTFSAGNFTIGGSAATGITTGTADDNTFDVTIAPEIVGTDVKQVTYTAGSGADLAGNLLASVANGDEAETDGASPVMISAETTSTTTVNVTFSEDLNGTTDAASDFTVAGVTVSGTSELAGVITLTTSAFGTGDTLLITMSALGNGVQDSVGNISPLGQTITPTDNVDPVITSVTSTTSNGSYNNPDVINITVNFSEAITSSVNFIVTLDTTGSCSFAVTSATSGSCNYTIADGENSADLTTTGITGTAADLASNAMASFVPGSNLAANAAIIVDTTEPVVSAIVLSPNGLHGVGDAVTITITADAAGYTASAVTVNGVAVTAYNDAGAGTYTATYTIVEGNTDRASGTVPASVALVDAAGNVNVAYTTVTANTVAVDANTPAAPIPTLLDPINAGNVTAVTITGTGEANASLAWSINDDNALTPAVTGVGTVDGLGAISISGINVSSLDDDLDLTLSITQTDAAGNTSAAGTDTALKDTVIPTLPAGNIVGATIQGANDTIVITFSEPVIAHDGTWSTNEFSAIESPDGTALNLTGANFSYSGSALTITLAESATDTATYLRNGDVIAVTPAASKIRDAALNYLSSAEVVGTTANTGDVVAPTVALTYSPNKAAYGWFEGVVITATFSEAIHEPLVGKPTITITTAGDGDTATVNMTKTSNTVWTYNWQTPGAQDEEGTATVTITATDLAGNANATATNNTRSIDNAGPVITAASATGVTTTAATLTATTDETATCRYSNVNTVYSAMLAMGTTGGTSHSHALSGLLAGAQHTYYVRCQDAGGNTGQWEAIVFTTLQPDTTVPTVTGQTPADNATGVSVAVSPTVTFSEVMDPSTVNSNTVKLKLVAGDVDVTGVVVTLSDSRLVATLNPSSALDYSTNYYIWVSGAKDAAGNDVTAYTTAVSQEFTTEASSADVTAPTVVSISPADNATNVGISTSIAVTFNEEMMESTISSTTIELRKYSDDSVIPASISLIEGNKVAHIMPTSNLSFATQYYVAVSTGVQDIVGNALATALDATTKASYEFTTVADSSDIVAPPVPAITTGVATTTASTYTILGTAAADTPSDSERVIRVYNGATLAGQVTLPIGQTSWSVVVGLSLDTGNSITATSTDASGNSSAASAAVVITNNASTDVDAPVISNVQATSITTTGVTITWTTDENATSNVEYGTTSSYGSSSAVDITANATSHSVAISGLASGTEYHFRVTSADALTNSVTSTDNTFTTVAVADTTAPAVPVFTTGVATTDADTYTLAGTVTNDGGARTVQLYNGATLVGSTVVPAGQTSWSLITALTQNTANVFSATASDVAGNTSGASSTITITEAATIGDVTDPATPVITTGAITVDADSYTITGTSGADLPSDGVRVITIRRNGTVVGSLSLSAGETAWSFVSPLLQSTTNAFSATSTDVSGNESAASSSVTITESATAPDTTAPAVPVFTTGAATVDADTYTLAGTVTDDGGARTIRILNGATLVGSTVVPAGQTTWSFLTALTQGTTNVFSATASDVVGNTSTASSTVTITEAATVGDTTAPATPMISGADTSVDATSYTLSGTAGADLPTDGARIITIYRGGVVVGSLTLPTGVTSWSFIAPLTQNVANTFTVTATDAAGNVSGTSNSRIITEAEGAAALEVTNISSDPSRAFAIANDTYASGWKWFFDVTVPTLEASVSMQFSNFVSGTNTIVAASNIRYYSAESSNAATSGAAITVSAAGTYAGAMTMTGDLDANTAGRQIRIIVEAKIPTGSAGGVYSADYGIQSL
ncbi:MAG: Ig-like domain-containing protein [Patescibacteria group bacterium]|mgnify:FL=1